MYVCSSCSMHSECRRQKISSLAYMTLFVVKKDKVKNTIMRLNIRCCSPFYCRFCVYGLLLFVGGVDGIKWYGDLRNTFFCMLDRIIANFLCIEFCLLVVAVCSMMSVQKACPGLIIQWMHNQEVFCISTIFLPHSQVGRWIHCATF